MRFFLVLFSILLHLSIVRAQLDPAQIPQACEQSCQQLLNLGTTCVAEYSSSGNSSASTACVCHGISDLTYSSCTSCLESASPTLARGLEQLSTFCTDFIKQCKYECDFTTCNSSDVACQCNESYLQDIYNCASCNSANGNTGATVLSDYTALRNSCFQQGYSATPTSIEAVPTPSGTIVITGQRSTSTGTVATGSTIMITLSNSNSGSSGTQSRSTSSSSANPSEPTTLNGGASGMHARLVGEVGLGQIFIAFCLTVLGRRAL